jgi:hypothetical protein
VRVAVAEACLPVLNIDRDLAVELFLTACSNQEAMLGTRRVWEFIRYALWSHSARLTPLLVRMARSSIASVATAGACGLTLIWLNGRGAGDVVEECRRGIPGQRRGVAMVAAHNASNPELVVRCAELLGGLIADPVQEVREQAGEFLRHENALLTPAMRQLAVRFISTPEFLRHSHWLVEAIRTHPEGLVPLTPVFEAVCDRLADRFGQGRGTAASDDRSDGFDLNRFVPLILRLYEQAEQARDTQLRNTCLDWWDRLLEARMAGAMQVLSDLETGRMTFF